MGVNQFSDITDKEFEEIYSGNEFTDEDDDRDLPDDLRQDDLSDLQEYEINWYTPAIPVKDQGKCSSCFTCVLGLNSIF